MNNNRFLLLPLSLMVIICGIFGPVGWGLNEEDLQSQIDQTKKKLSQTKLKENSVLGNLLRTQNELDKISSNIEKLDSNIGMAERKMEVIKSQYINAQSELERLEKEIIGYRGVLDQRLVAIYKYGYQSYLEVLLTARNFGEFVSRFEMVGGFVEDDVHILKNLKKQQKQVSQKKQEIVAKQEELEVQKKVYSKLQNQSRWAQSHYLSKFQDTQKELSEIQNDRKRYEKALDELEELSNQMESQIRNYQNKNRTALGSGQLIWPTPGNIKSYFGFRVHPILRKRKNHTGIDIATPMGTNIVAADTGEVLFSGRNGGYGKMIIIDHGAEMSTVYAHCSELLVTEAQTVTKGQVIAKVGSTGLSTGPHLHFEVRKNGVPVNPLDYL